MTKEKKKDTSNAFEKANDSLIINSDGKNNNLQQWEIGELPAMEVILKSILMLMSAAAEKLGLSQKEEDDIESKVDLDEARKLITALSHLFTGSRDTLGLHARPIKDGIKALQAAFREKSAFPDEAEAGPGEKII